MTANTIDVGDDGGECIPLHEHLDGADLHYKVIETVGVESGIAGPCLGLHLTVLYGGEEYAQQHIVVDLLELPASVRREQLLRYAQTVLRDWAKMLLHDGVAGVDDRRSSDGE